jgi:hypothetical protein
MATNSTWLPGARADRFTMVSFTDNFMADTANRIAIGFETTSKNGKWFDLVLIPKLHAYVSTYLLWADPASSTPVVSEDLRDAEKEFFPLYRKFHSLVVATPAVSNGQLEAMGFPPRPTGGRTPHPVNTMFLSLKLIPVANLAINVAFENRDTEKSTIPYYLTGAVLFYKVGDAPATNQNELPESELATRSPYKLKFDPSQRGKCLSVAGRWQNRRGEKGPWSEIVTLIIP